MHCAAFRSFGTSQNIIPISSTYGAGMEDLYTTAQQIYFGSQNPARASFYSFSNVTQGVLWRICKEYVDMIWIYCMVKRISRRLIYDRYIHGRVISRCCCSQGEHDLLCLPWIAFSNLIPKQRDVSGLIGSYSSLSRLQKIIYRPRRNLSCPHCRDHRGSTCHCVASGIHSFLGRLTIFFCNDSSMF
jgi:hypothetical protein